MAGRITISIHALLAESDGLSYFYIIKITGFLSTLSLRRATIFIMQGRDNSRFLSTLSLRRATSLTLHKRRCIVFLSTLSLRRATRLGLLGWLRVLISIHALLAESDFSVFASPFSIFYFYPRSPCGERRTMTTTICTASKFLSTLSLRRATICV